MITKPRPSSSPFFVHSAPLAETSRESAPDRHDGAAPHHGKSAPHHGDPESEPGPCRSLRAAGKSIVVAREPEPGRSSGSRACAVSIPQPSGWSGPAALRRPASLQLAWSLPVCLQLARSLPACRFGSPILQQLACAHCQQELLTHGAARENASRVGNPLAIAAEAVRSNRQAHQINS